LRSAHNNHIQQPSHIVTSTRAPKKSKALRYILTIIGLLVIVGSLGFIKFSQISSLISMGKEMEAAGPPPEAVGSAVAESQIWEGTLSAIGSIASVKGVAITNDAAGVVTRISFESGGVVKQGQILVELDTAVERAQLGSARSRRDIARLTAERSRALLAERVLAQAQVDADEATLRTANAELEAIQAQIARKSVRAPFAGRLGIRNVNLGQYLAPGTQLTVLEAIGAVYVDFTLPQQWLGTVKVGMPVRVTVENVKDLTVDGTISAVDPTVDNATRNLKLRASVENKDDRLRPGMFAKVVVVLPEKAGRVIVPATSIVHAPYGDSVFVIEDKKPDAPGMRKTPDGKPVRVARQQFVRLGEARGDFVAIVDGVTAGQEVVSAGAFKLRNSSPILIDNRVKAEAQLNPRPENH
jgi:membrane fusion protein (multidrug efflux system)